VTFTIRLAKSGVAFDAEADEVILDAAERANVILTHSCRSGTCRACITRVIAGCLEHDPDYIDELSIDAGEIAAGYRLLCSSFARSDAELER